MPSSFSSIIFNRHGSMIESGEVESNFSKIYFFLHAITDRSQGINPYMNNVSISRFTSQSQLNDWAGVSFDRSKLVWFQKKNTMTDAVIKCLKHINRVSNSNTV